jgi:hypothetical protein
MALQWREVLVRWHRGKATEWPAFDAPLLQDIAEAFRRRGKAIRYQTTLFCERDFSETADGVLERLNLDLCHGHVRLSVWDDGVMWLSVCVRGVGRNSGWAFKDDFHGDVLDLSGQSLVRMVETTLAMSFGVAPAAEEREQLRELWRPVRPCSG